MKAILWTAYGPPSVLQPGEKEYFRLLDPYHDAYDRIQAGEAGSGYGGIHYFEVISELARMIPLPIAAMMPSTG